jgi:hypothetical protein
MSPGSHALKPGTPAHVSLDPLRHPAPAPTATPTPIFSK